MRKKVNARIVCGSTYGSGYLELQNKLFGFWCCFERAHISPKWMPEEIERHFRAVAKQLDWEIVEEK